MNKKIFLATTLLLFSIVFISGSLYSQQDKMKNMTPEEQATKMSDRMKKNLSLNDDQYKQVYSLMLSKAQDRVNNKAKFQSMDKASRKAMMKQNKESFNKQMEGILTNEQYQKYQQNMSKYGKHKGNKKHKTQKGE